MQNARLDKSQAGIKTAERNISNFRYADDTVLMAERVKKESEKSGLKLNIQKMKIMAFDPITSWQTEGEKVETVIDFLFLAPKSLWTVTAAMKLKCTCSLGEKL